VNLGDTFRDGKYKVIRKLGDGSYSTVWLAVSTGYVSSYLIPLLLASCLGSPDRNYCYSTPRYVALKIMVAKAPAADTELRILDFLSKLASRDTGAQHVTVLLDTFQHQGINGKHQCLVFEPMGATTASLVGELPENKPKKYGKR